MTASDPLVGASKPATRDIQYLGSDLPDSLGSMDGTLAALRAWRDATGELGYGCVDWFIYVTNSDTVATTLQLAGQD